MKKRILSLVLSMVLLLITAVPAFAWGYDPSSDELASGFSAPGTSYTGESVSGNYTYRMRASLLDDQDIWHYYADEVYYNPNVSEDIYLDGTVSAGIKTWTGSGWVDSMHRTALETLATSMNFYSSVSNQEQSYSFVIDSSYAKDYYTVVLSCWHYQLSSDVYYNGLMQSSQTISYIPHLGGDFIFLDCP